MTYVILEDDNQGELVEIHYFCSKYCAPLEAESWPGGMETDYDVSCQECGDLMWEGLET